MKGNRFKIFIVLTLFLSNVSYADFIFYSNAPDICNEISGQWELRGKASHWLLEDCVYQGSGYVSILESSGKFSTDVSAQKKSGSFLCPSKASTKLHGTCIDGLITVITHYGSLSGNFSNSTGNANGTSALSPGINVNVSIQFVRNEP